MSYSSQLANLKSISKEVIQEIKKNKKRNIGIMTTVTIFDLSDSTSLKLKLGHDKAMQIVLFHNEICRRMIKKFSGVIIKEVGDGIIARFNNPINACLTAINIRQAINLGLFGKGQNKRKITTKASLVMGVVEKIKIKNRYDVFGLPIDRCSRIEKYALPNQILMDGAVFDSTKSFLGNYSDIKIGKPNKITIRGYGKSILYEIGSSNFKLKNKLNKV